MNYLQSTFVLLPASFSSTSYFFSSGNFWDNFKNRCFLAWGFLFVLLCSFAKKKTGRTWQGNLSVFEITRASVLFPENFRCNLKLYESKNFSDSSLYRIFESENFRFSFTSENSLTWGVKCEKFNFWKLSGIYKISFEKRSSGNF